MKVAFAGSFAPRLAEPVKARLALPCEIVLGDENGIVARLADIDVLVSMGAEYMNIAGELEVHATEELQHAITLSNQIDYLGGMPTATAKPVVLTEDNKTMLRADLNNETETILNYRERIKQCEELGEYAIAEHIREILIQEQDHLIALATALGIDPPKLEGTRRPAK